MGARGAEERGRGALLRGGGGGPAAQEGRDRGGADPADQGEGVREEPAALGLADRAVPAEDGGAAAVARHIGQQSEGRPEDAGAAHDEVPDGHFSGEGKECFFSGTFRASMTKFKSFVEAPNQLKSCFLISP